MKITKYNVTSKNDFVPSKSTPEKVYFVTCWHASLVDTTVNYNACDLCCYRLSNQFH
jgi:hypothetical protein